MCVWVVGDSLWRDLRAAPREKLVCDRQPQHGQTASSKRHATQYASLPPVPQLGGGLHTSSSSTKITHSTSAPPPPLEYQTITHHLLYRASKQNLTRTPSISDTIHSHTSSIPRYDANEPTPTPTPTTPTPTPKETEAMISAILLVILTIFLPPVGVYCIAGCGADREFLFPSFFLSRFLSIRRS